MLNLLIIKEDIIKHERSENNDIILENILINKENTLIKYNTIQ